MITVEQVRVLDAANQITDDYIAELVAMFSDNLDAAIASLKQLCDVANFGEDRDEIRNATNLVVAFSIAIDAVIQNRMEEAQLKQYGKKLN